MVRGVHTITVPAHHKRSSRLIPSQPRDTEKVLTCSISRTLRLSSLYFVRYFAVSLWIATVVAYAFDLGLDKFELDTDIVGCAVLASFVLCCALLCSVLLSSVAPFESLDVS